MVFASFADLLAMDGHGSYVWFCYGVGLLVLSGLVLEARRRRRQAEQTIRSIVRRKQANTVSN
jgi:heme exporter protein D